jgi:hypothetical protein
LPVEGGEGVHRETSGVAAELDGHPGSGVSQRGHTLSGTVPLG